MATRSTPVALYIEKARDKTGYRQYPLAVIEAADDRNNGMLYVKNPAEFQYYRVPKCDFQRVSNRAGVPRLIRKPLKEAYREMNVLIQQYAETETVY